MFLSDLLFLCEPLEWDRNEWGWGVGCVSGEWWWVRSKSYEWVDGPQATDCTSPYTYTHTHTLISSFGKGVGIWCGGETHERAWCVCVCVYTRERERGTGWVSCCVPMYVKRLIDDNVSYSVSICDLHWVSIHCYRGAGPSFMPHMLCLEIVVCKMLQSGSSFCLLLMPMTSSQESNVDFASGCWPTIGGTLLFYILYTLLLLIFSYANLFKWLFVLKKVLFPFFLS